jgi:hypothetical protein
LHGDDPTAPTVRWRVPYVPLFVTAMSLRSKYLPYLYSYLSRYTD